MVIVRLLSGQAASREGAIRAGLDVGDQVPAGVMTAWDLWVDFHRIDSDGLTHAHLKDLTRDVELHDGQYLLVGDEDADPAISQVVALQPDGEVLLRVLPGHADLHRELLTDQSA